MPSGRALYPGVEQVHAWEYTRSHGITPGVATLELVPQASFVPVGNSTLFLTYDGGVSIPITNSKIDYSKLKYDASGRLVVLAILDRRWKWAFGQLDGNYNLRDDSGSVIELTAKTSQELAIICLEAMGESGYDVDDVPNTFDVTTVHWQGENPAQALQKLCDEWGMRIVLQLDDSVALRVQGDGADLPSVDIVDGGLTYDPPETPDSVRVICAKNRYQHDFLLEAVGMDTDGKIRLIDDLSYKPAVGWPASFRAGFSNLIVLDSTLKTYNRAKECIYKWYRVVVPTDIRGYGGVDDIIQILPIETVQVETRLDNSKDVSKDALVYGIRRSPISIGNTATAAPYTEPFSIDRELGVVKFSNYTFKYVNPTDPTTLTVAEATLYLRCAVSIRDPVTWAWQQKYFDRPLPGGIFGTGPHLLLHDELVLNTHPTYDTDGISQIGEESNEAVIEAAADYYLDAAEGSFNPKTPLERRYAGIKPIELDGAIMQVTWSYDASGYFTHASRNDEASLAIPPYKERRRQEYMRAAKTMQILGDRPRLQPSMAGGKSAKE